MTRVRQRWLERSTVAVAFAALVVAVLSMSLLVVGRRPDGSDGRLLIAAVITAVGTAAGAPALRRSLTVWVRGRSGGSTRQPDDIVRQFAGRLSRVVPLDELLGQLVDQLRLGLGLASAELWIGRDGVFELAASSPPRRADPVHLGTREIAVVLGSTANGGAWASVWIDDVLAGRDPASIRVAPIAHAGTLHGLLLIDAGPGGGVPGEAIDRMLTDLGRSIGHVLHNVRLDAQLEASFVALRLANAELQASRARLVAVADEERSRIERDLHDGAQQHLVAMAMKLGHARDLVAVDPVAAADALAALNEQLRIATTELRSIAHGVYPPLLETGGLDEALAPVALRAGLPVVLDVRIDARPPHEVEAAVYFCCVEALQNVAKHAGTATAAEVRVRATATGVELSVRDDGQGFDTANRGSAHGGRGLVNLADRLAAVGGTLVIESSPGSGTAVRGTVPLGPSAAT